MKNPVVSIVCITYNHEPYLRQTLEGFLLQKTAFPVEIILAEDCSTDGTRAICEEYATKYSDKIHYIWSESNVGAIANEIRASKAARGKYVAFCEGDDYWTDPLKLQKQVDFMDAHPEYSVTFHRCKHMDIGTGQWKDDSCGALFTNGEDGIDIDIPMFFSNWYTQPLTMVYRTDCLDLDKMINYKHYRDMHQIYHLLKEGKGYLFAFLGGVRILHAGGQASQRSSQKACDDSLAIAQELYDANHDTYTANYYAEVLQWAIYKASQYGYNKWDLSMRLFSINHDFCIWLKNILR